MSRDNFLYHSNSFFIPLFGYKENREKKNWGVKIEKKTKFSLVWLARENGKERKVSEK